MIRLFYVEKT